jgi:hypothetical protein
MKASDVVIRAVVGLLVGAGVGAVVGFVTFAVGEKLSSTGSGFVIFMPSGPLMVGIMGAVVMGIVGIVVGLLTGGLNLRPLPAAGLGILIFLLLKARTIYLDMGSATKSEPNRGLISINTADVFTLINLVMIAVLVALVLHRLFASGTSEAGTLTN